MLKTVMTKGAIPELMSAVSFTAQRHRVIVNNIANVDTPFFIAQDLSEDDFRKQLRDAINRRETGNPRFFSLKPTRTIPINEHGLPRPKPASSDSVGQMRHDVGTVDYEMEMAKLAKNASLHAGLVQVLSHQYGLIASAITGRPRG